MYQLEEISLLGILLIILKPNFATYDWFWTDGSQIRKRCSNWSVHHIMQNYKQKYKGEDETGGYGEHHLEKKIAVASPRILTSTDEPTIYCIGFLEERKRRRFPQKNWKETVNSYLRSVIFPLTKIEIRSKIILFR